MKKFMILGILAITILAFSPEKKDLIVSLHAEVGYGVFMPGRLIIFPAHDSIDYKGIPDDIKEFAVRSIPLQSGQYYWDLYKKGEIAKERFANIVNRFQLDTAQLASISYDYQVIAAIGTNQKGNRIIIIDSDNDEDFSDERILEYKFPASREEQKKIDDSLPTIVTKYQYYCEGRIIDKTIRLKPSPYKGSLDLVYETSNETEKKYDLFISIPEYRKGKITINQTKYAVLISNGFTSPSYTGAENAIFFTSCREEMPSELSGDIPYQTGDIINLKGSDYLLNSISLWGDTMKLKYLGENVRPVGITEGLFIPKFEASKLDNSDFSLEQYPNKYILIDFWGTWCNPCIASIPGLKQLNAEFGSKNLLIVSVAYDRDTARVQEFIRKYQMEWEHVFVDQKLKDRNSLVEKLKVTSFPTTLLIAPDGKIIARNKSIDQLKGLLKNAL
jgi:thiol-disulfide isomerase/thioredoxin